MRAPANPLASTGDRTAEYSRGPGARPVGERLRLLLAMPPHRRVAQFCGASRLARDLTACVTRIGRIIDEAHPVIGDCIGATALAGKRLRPLVMLAVGYASADGLDDAGRERLVRAAVSVELLHLASLAHDDVMDEAALRHGVPSANARAGNARAVLAGDYLLARALALASTLGEGERAARTFAALCEGQARETQTLFDIGRVEDDYFAAVSGKTSALFACGCAMAAAAGDAPAPVVAALTECGHHLGIAFQVVDDLLDIEGDAESLGKPVGHDIVEGVYTLPVLRALRERPELGEVLGMADRRTAARRMIAAVRRGGALASTRGTATEHARLAVQSLAAARDGLDPAGVDMLADLIGSLITRSR